MSLQNTDPVDDSKSYVRTLRIPASVGEQHESFDIDSGIERLETDMRRTRRQGLWGLITLRWEAWLEERMKDPAIRKLKAQQAVLQEQTRTAKAQIELRSTVLSGERDGERKLTEYNQAHQHRVQSDGDPLGLPTVRPNTLPADAPLSVAITDEQIEAMALRAVSQIPRGSAGEEQLARYIADLKGRLPTYAAMEVEERIHQLRSLAS